MGTFRPYFSVHETKRKSNKILPSLEVLQFLCSLFVECVTDANKTNPSDCKQIFYGFSVSNLRQCNYSTVSVYKIKFYRKE